ncbi:MAG: tyrosine-type recombinase/integrase, partial [Candidatus Hodarchaeales archaeon]
EVRNTPLAKPAQLKIRLFYKWLIGKDTGDYEPTEKIISENTAKTMAYSRIRGFYSHNGIIFPKRFRAPEIESESKVDITDRKLRIIKYDNEGLPFIDDDMFQSFFKRLRFRDQVICACQVGGGGHDLVDLLKLTVGQVRDNNHYSRDGGTNFLWSGNRQKTGKQFKVPFSSSATTLLKDYVKRERFEAKDDELVFLKKEDENGRILTPNAVGNNYKNALYQAFNITNGYNEYNPLRPKRFRHIFTTICTKRASILNISPNMIRLWQGHASNIQDGYVENDWPTILRDYRKVEEYFQVLDVVKTDTDKEIDLLRKKNEELELCFAGLQKEVEGVVKMYEELLHEKHVRNFNKQQDLIIQDTEKMLRRKKENKHNSNE